MVSCTSGLAPALLRFAFPQQAADNAGTALRLLALGQGAFAIFGIETTVLVSLSRERWSAMVTGGAALLVACLCWALVPSSPFDSTLLVRTALSTSLALMAASVTGAFLVLRAAGSFAPAKTVVRTGLALGTAIALGSFLPWMGRAFLAVEVVLVVGAYLAVAIVTREITKSDLSMVLSIVGRKRATTTAPP
jgi:stage V sporulation protein B